ncbi:MAG: hypothetical protein B6D38_10645 [Anaerolineae bacterium UTCFX1]|nr:MAG: hypothetical protein B6D38_10645 [Anaerolineae bacterium UTCFX1]
MFYMTSKFKEMFLKKRGYIAPLALFLIFLAFTLPGVSWGAPGIWHPDEIVVRVISALHGEWKFSEYNFDYPDLPQYAMFYLGKIILALGYSDGEILMASRFLSVALGGLIIVLSYFITRRIGGSVRTAFLAGLLLICVTPLSSNARFAHNDMYVVFFITFIILFLLCYLQTGRRGWLYAAFTTVGMAASSKYTGGSMAFVVLIVYFILHWKTLCADWFRIAETLFIGGTLMALGYALGTPKALTWMAYYFKRVFAVLNWQVNYGRNPGSVRGIIGQYAVLQDGLGTALFLILALSFLWACFRVARSLRNRSLTKESRVGGFAVLLLTIFAIDFPIMLSYNYQLRYFLPLMPPLAILAAFFIEKLIARAKLSRFRILPAVATLTLSIVILYSFARLISAALLFINDTRIPATQFMLTLPAGASLEHTNYPPNYPEGYFSREHNYPLYIKKGSTDIVPTNKTYEFNKAEEGLLDRKTDYLVVDNFTADRLKDKYVCEQVPQECEFFAQLEQGGTERYRQIAEFKYALPPWLPQIRILFANPVIRIYERVQ